MAIAHSNLCVEIEGERSQKDMTKQFVQSVKTVTQVLPTYRDEI